MQLARRYYAGRVSIGSTDAGSASPDATAEVNLFGTPEEVVDRIEMLREDFIDGQKKIRETEGRVEWTGQYLRDTAFLADHHLHMVLRRRYPSCPLPYSSAHSPASNSIVVSSRPTPAAL
jgi:hypothetical protein